MKDVYYNGSITDDIELVNNRDKELKNLKWKKWRNILLLTAANLLWAVLGTWLGSAIFMWCMIVASGMAYAASYSRIYNAITSREDKQYDVQDNIKELAYNLADDLTNSKDLTSNISYQNIKDAVVISDEEEYEKDYDEDEDISRKDFEEYLKIVTSDIYFFDSNSRIKALREVKKIAKRVKDKTPYTKEIKLSMFEEQDFPYSLPVKQVLRLKKNSK